MDGIFLFSDSFEFTFMLKPKLYHKCATVEPNLVTSFSSLVLANLAAFEGGGDAISCFPSNDTWNKQKIDTFKNIIWFA